MSRDIAEKEKLQVTPEEINEQWELMLAQVRGAPQLSTQPE